jgi:hypothetical protein
MTDYEKDEFWKALGRLYDSSVVMQENIERMGARIDRLGEIVERLAEVSTTHEKRLDRAEVVIEAILGDLKKLREGRA